MNKILYTILLSLFISCNGQNEKSNNKKKTNMSNNKFDVSNFENFIANGGDKNSLNPFVFERKKNDTLIKEYAGINTDTGEKEYQRDIVPPAPNLFYAICIFDENGNVKQTIDQVFIGTFHFKYGIHRFYDKEGNLKKTIDYNNQFRDFKIKIIDLLKILSNEKLKVDKISDSTQEELRNKWFDVNEKVTPEMVIKKLQQIFKETKQERGSFEEKFLNPNNRKDVERIGIDFDLAKKHWIIIKDFSVLGRIYLVIDGTSGKIIDNRFEI